MNTQSHRAGTLTHLAMFALVLLVAAAASAQTHSNTMDKDWNDVKNNPCLTPTDTVTLQGHMHVVTNQSTDGNGTVHLVFNMQEQGSGQGSVFYGNPAQTLSYSYNGQTKSNGKFPAPPDGQPVVTFREFDNLVSHSNIPGVPDNWQLLTVFRLYKDGSTTNSFDTRCRG